MIEDDKQAAKEFMRGALFTTGVAALALLIVAGIGLLNSDEVEPKPSTKVVDTYKGCDIVQWHYGPIAEYKYFLHCPNEKSHSQT